MGAEFSEAATLPKQVLFKVNSIPLKILYRESLFRPFGAPRGALLTSLPVHQREKMDDKGNNIEPGRGSQPPKQVTSLLNRVKLFPRALKRSKDSGDQRDGVARTGPASTDLSTISGLVDKLFDLLPAPEGGP